MDSGFQSPSLAGLKTAVGDFLDSLGEVLNSDCQQLTCRAPQLLQRIRETHFQPPESCSVLLQQLISKLEECQKEVCKNLQNRKFKESNMTMQMAKMLEMIWEEKRSLMKMKAECKDMTVMRAVLNTMQQQVKEKNEEIAQLRRASIVQLWEREKQKVLSRALERERALKEETKDKMAQWMELKEKLIKKMKGQQEEIQKLRLKEKIYAKSLSRLETQGLKEELKSLRQQLLMTERDLLESGSEIMRQQQQIAMFLTGLSTYIRKVALKQDSGYYLSPADFHHIRNQLDVICRTLREGSLRSLPAGSPEAQLTPPQDVRALLQVPTPPPENRHNLNGQVKPEKHKGTSAVSANQSASGIEKKVKKGRRSKVRPIQRSIDQSELKGHRSQSVSLASYCPPPSSSPTEQGKPINDDHKLKGDQSESPTKGQLTVSKAAWGVVQSTKLNPGLQDSCQEGGSGLLDTRLTQCHNQSFRDNGVNKMFSKKL